MDYFAKLDIKTENMDLSTRTFKYLKKSGFDSVFDILKEMPITKSSALYGHKMECDEITYALIKLGYKRHFLLACSNICTLLSGWMLERNDQLNFVRFLDAKLLLLGCDSPFSLKTYTVFQEKNASLPIQQQIIKFVLGYYPHYMDKILWPGLLLDEDGDIVHDVPNDVRILTESPDAIAAMEKTGIYVKPSALTALERMTGLQNIKEMVHNITAHCTISKMKQQAGVDVPSFVPNAIFLGNPGTGKTTVAKIIAQLYKEIGLLEKGQLITAGQADLIGAYLGQTAPKVKEVFKSALGGVLFVDEAYSLNDGYVYGKEAVSTLTNMMTEFKGQCCVILAGYEQSMNQMMRDVNPGLRDRFPFRLVFGDYTVNELMEIFSKKLEDNKTNISREGRRIVFETINTLYQNKDDQFANARLIDNIFQAIMFQQERRLYHEHMKNQPLTQNILLSIRTADCVTATQKILEQNKNSHSKTHPIGFITDF